MILEMQWKICVRSMGVNSRKISSDYYIDDRALNIMDFSEWSEELE